MRQYSYYDPTEKVIFTDMTGLDITTELVREIQGEIIELSRTLPQKVFVVVCWKDAKLSPQVAEGFGDGLTKMLDYIVGVVRYGVNSDYSNIVIRTQTVKHHLQDTRSHIYTTKEAALAAVHRMQSEGKN